MAVAEVSHWAGNGAGWPEPGQTYQDPAGGAVVLVLTASLWPAVLRCGGVPMVVAQPLPCGYHARARIDLGTVLRPGPRYRDPVSGLEVRCLRSGVGHLTYTGHWLIAMPQANEVRHR
jgi:hypothetical protein